MLLARTGGRFDVALPDADARRFLSDIKNNSSAFFDMLALIKTERSECSRLEDRDRIFDAVRSIEGGFCSVDRMVFRAMSLGLCAGLKCKSCHPKNKVSRPTLQNGSAC